MTSTPFSFTIGPTVLQAAGTDAATATPLVRLDQTTIYQVFNETYGSGSFVLPSAEQGAQVGDVFQLIASSMDTNYWSVYPDPASGFSNNQYDAAYSGNMRMLTLLLIAPGVWAILCN